MSKRPAPKKTNGTNGATVHEFKVTINVENLTWEDMYLMTAIQGAEGKFTREVVADIRALFNRVVEGGAAAVPVVYTQSVMEQLGEAIALMGNPGNSGPA